jgi:hypothetical protein
VASAAGPAHGPDSHPCRAPTAGDLEAPAARYRWLGRSFSVGEGVACRIEPQDRGTSRLSVHVWATLPANPAGRIAEWAFTRPLRGIAKDREQARTELRYLKHIIEQLPGPPGTPGLTRHAAAGAQVRLAMVCLRESRGCLDLHVRVPQSPQVRVRGGGSPQKTCQFSASQESPKQFLAGEPNALICATRPYKSGRRSDRRVAGLGF